MEEIKEIGPTLPACPPCVMVIFGATGDLTARKLFPALYNLTKEGRLSEHFVCVGFARRPKSHEQFREEMKQAVQNFSRSSEIDIRVWESLENRIFYHQANFSDEEGFASLKTFLEQLDHEYGTQGNRLFYLSTPPDYFQDIIRNLNRHQLFYHEQGAQQPWSRLIIEKPFGVNLETAQELQQCIDANIDEESVYRIDHYLGKETVQNILTIRFANTLFESCWNSQYIDHQECKRPENLAKDKEIITCCHNCHENKNVKCVAKLRKKPLSPMRRERLFMVCNRIVTSVMASAA